MVVVENEHEVGSGTAQLLEKHRQYVILDLVGARSQRSHGGLAGAGFDATKGEENVGPQPHRIDVPCVQGHPRAPSVREGRQPGSEQRGLAVAGRCGQQGQIGRLPCLEPLDQEWAADGPGRQPPGQDLAADDTSILSEREGALLGTRIVHPNHPSHVDSPHGSGSRCRSTTRSEKEGDAGSERGKVVPQIRSARAAAHLERRRAFHPS